MTDDDLTPVTRTQPNPAQWIMAGLLGALVSVMGVAFTVILFSLGGLRGDIVQVREDIAKVRDLATGVDTANQLNTQLIRILTDDTLSLQMRVGRFEQWQIVVNEAIFPQPQRVPQPGPGNDAN